MMLSNISMNVVKMSAAGSGKTWDICHDALNYANNGNRVLIVTYTNRGINSILCEIKKQNGGVLHELIHVKTWYHFLLSDIIKPYQNYIVDRRNINFVKSIDFEYEDKKKRRPNKFKIGNPLRYMIGGNIKSDYASEMAYYINEYSHSKAIRRLSEIYAGIFFDEIQDLAGYDLQLIELLFDSSISITCCGDNKQATFSTHNSTKNKKKSGKNVWKFFHEYEAKGEIFFQKNLVSRRFNRSICSFANGVFPMGDPISTKMQEITEHDGVFLIGTDCLDSYYQYFHPQILRYDTNTYTYGYQAVTFGSCKGETFDRVLIFPNKPFSDYIFQGKTLAAPEKYYVAVTRPRYSIAIIADCLPFYLQGYEATDIVVGSEKITALRYIG